MRYRFGEIEIDDRLYQLRRAGSVLHVEPRVFDLLLYLVRHRDRAVTKPELLEAVWQGVAVSDSVLSTAMNGVRRTLGASGRGEGPIETLYGRGYRFRAPVEEQAEPDAAPVPPPAAAPPTPSGDDTFVGRDAVLEALRAALASAVAGEGRVALLCGEAGIGKTRAAEELARHAEASGAAVLAARCPEAAAAPAFWPWTQILRAALASEAGAALPGELSALVPELRDESGDGPERFRLFDAVTERLRANARRRPLLVWIDDLQWADAASLQLATWAARELRDAAVLLLATVRESSAAPPALAAALAELARLDHAQRIDLAGLEAASVARYLEATVGSAPAAAVQALCARTEGNPFFLRELVRLGASEGTDAERLAAWTENVPSGAREVVRRRIAALAPRTRATLALAAAIGREFPLRLLAEAADTAREELLAALDEAVGARLLSAVPGALARQRFSHGLVRDAIYGEVVPGERALLHERIARALERLAPDRGEPAWAELAHHWGAAAVRGDAAPAVRYAVLAARDAQARGAWEEAAVQYERAFAARELVASGDAGLERPLDLLLALGEAHLRAGDVGATQATFARAADLARAAGDTAAFVRAALGYAGSALWGNRPDASSRGLLEEAQALLGDGAPALRAQLASRIAVIRAYSGALADEHERAALALKWARESGDLEALSEALHARHYVLQGVDHLDERETLAGEILAIGRALGRSDRTFAIREALASDHLVRGDRAGFETAIADALATARDSHHPAFLWLATGAAASVALLEGRFDAAERGIEECAAWGRRTRNPGAAPLGLGHSLALRRDRGGLGALRGLFDALGDRFDWVGAYPRVVRAVVYAEVGDLEAARRVYEPLAARDFRDLPRRADWLIAVAEAAGVCAQLGDAARAEVLDALLAPYDALHAVFPGPMLYAGPVSRFRARLAVLRGDREGAGAAFERALAACAAVGARPVRARVALEFGRFLAADPAAEQRSRALLGEAHKSAESLAMIDLAQHAKAALDATRSGGASAH
jgi:DNA-binding winged helix-turn-helix (wHTH) protein